MTRSLSSPRNRGLSTGCTIILVIFAVILLALGIGGWYVYSNWKGWAAMGMEEATKATLADSGLPQDQRDKILAEVQKFGTDFKEGRITVEQFGKVMEQVVESPLLPLAGVHAARAKYVEPSTMTAEEKAAAVRSLQRFARGITEKKITPPQQVIDDVVKPVTTLKPDGRWEMKANPTRQELDQFIANVKAKADEAKIPDEPYDLNIADELTKAINTALGRG